MGKRRAGPPGNRAPDQKVVSIVDELQRRRIARERERASAMCLRELELSLERVEGGMRIKEADFDAELAQLDRLAPEQARVARSVIRDARALQSCLRGNPEAGFAEWAEVIVETPELADPHLVRGRWVMQTDPSAAMVDYDRAVTLEPRNPTAYWRRGDCLLALGDQDRALANYRRALALDPSSIDLLQATAKLLALRGEHAEAASTYGRAIAQAPGYADFYFGRAKALDEVGDLDGALRDYAKILELDPSRDDVRFYRVICHERAGHLAEAVAEMEELIVREPDDHHNHRVLGKLHLEMGALSPAVEALSRAIALAPDDASAYPHRGFALWRSGERARALSDFDRAIALEPDEPEHWFARVLARAPDLPREETRAEVDRLLALHPDAVVMLEHRAKMLHEDGAHAAALADLDRAVALLSADPELRVARAQTYAALGRVDEAFTEAEAAISLAPDHAVAHVIRAIYRRHLEGEPALVEADLDRAVMLDPLDASIFNQRGLYLSDQGRFAAALADFDRAIAIAPRAASLYYERACCKCRLDEERMEADPDWDEADEEREARCRGAIADLERAIELGARDEDVYLELWGAYQQLGDSDGEIAALDRGVLAVPDGKSLLYHRCGVRSLRGDAEGAAADRARAEVLGFKFEG